MLFVEELPSSILREISGRVIAGLDEAMASVPEAELRARVKDALAVRDFAGALAGRFGLIAEIKRKSPSMGEMRAQGVAEIARVYEESPAVRALSVLTNEADFGMSLRDLEEVRAVVTKPILRKDFIFSEYQVWQARAAGADAILLMANLVTVEGLRVLSELAESLGMAVLFETHDPAEIAKLPANAKIVGINSRKFVTSGWGAKSGASDSSIDLGYFELAHQLPAGALKVAESGISPGVAPRLRDELGFHSLLVGTSILNHPAGAAAALREFEERF